MMKSAGICCVLLTLAFSGSTCDCRAAEGDAPRQTSAAAHFHHVRLNVVSRDASIRYYTRFFGAVPVRFRGIADAVLTDRSFLLFNTVPDRAPDNAQTALWHIGWGGVDGHSEYEWRTEQGITWQTPLTEVATSGGPKHFMYAHGPDREIVEIWTGTPHHRYNHIHLLADDVNATADWYVRHLGARPLMTDIPRPPPPPDDLQPDNPNTNVFQYIWMSAVQVDGVTFNIFSRPDESTFWWSGEPIRQFEKTDGHVINHVAFSYADIQAVHDRMQRDGVDIVQPVAFNRALRLKSFFIRGPDRVLIEIVEADPLPDAGWMRHIPPSEQRAREQR